MPEHDFARNDGPVEPKAPAETTQVRLNADNAPCIALLTGRFGRYTMLAGAVHSKRAQMLPGRGKGRSERLLLLIPTRDEARRNRALRWLGPLLEREWLWHLNRRAVASGAALGVFLGLIVPVGQMPLAAAGAVLLRANLPAAALGTLVSNPFTVGPIYWLAYRTGSAVLDPAGSNRDLSGVTAAVGSGQSGPPLDWLDQVANAGEPLMLGLALFAAGGALLTYLAVRLAWRLNVQWQRRRHRATDKSNPSHSSP